MRQFITKHKNWLEWFHISVALALITIPGIWANYASSQFNPTLAGCVFLLCLLGFCQNIGIVHNFAHILPKGPKWLGSLVAKGMHALGGLKYTSATFSHNFHHGHLGTHLDPDRHGYDQTTNTFAKRLRYLFFIGPIRTRYAPVDISPFVSRWSAERKAAFDKAGVKESFLRIGTHLLLFAFCGPYYLFVFAALIFSNVLSNIREMTEHGNKGAAGLVNIRPSLIGLLFFSTPGFWYHGYHHQNPLVHYLELPLRDTELKTEENTRYIRRTSYLKYMIHGA